MNVEIKNYPSARTLVAEICGDIDHHTAKYFRGEIDKAIRSHNPLTLILDYSQVTFMDSSGIGLVMGRYRIMSEMGGEVIVASPPAYIRKVLQLAGMHRLTKIVTDIAPYIQEKKAAQEQNESPDDKQRRVIKLKRKPLNEMKVSFPSYSENERFARVAVSGFLTQLDPQIDELADVKTAVSEGVTNAIVHGYRNTLGEIFMQIRIFENRHVYIKIRDKGCGIADVEQAMQPLFTTAPEEERAGLGFAVMESFMDKVKVRSKLGEGTTLILEKTLKERV